MLTYGAPQKADNDNVASIRRQALALQTIASVMSSWIGIMMVTSIGGDTSSIVKKSEQDILTEGSTVDDETLYGKVVHCIRAYIEEHIPMGRSSAAARPPANAPDDDEAQGYDTLSDSDHEQEHEVPRQRLGPRQDDDDEEHMRHRDLPQSCILYIQSLRQKEDTEFEVPNPALDPTIPRRPEACQCVAWDFCWKHIARGSNEGMRIALFRPLLLHIAIIARNMVKANALYLMDYIVKIDEKDYEDL